MNIYTPKPDDEIIISLREWFLNNPFDPSECGHEKLPGFNTGIPHSEETKQRLREVNLGKKLSEETKNKIKNSLKGVPKTDEWKEKISKGKLGIKQTDSAKEKLSKHSSKGEYTFISPSGEKFIHHSIIKFAKNNGLSSHLLYTNVNKGRIFSTSRLSDKGKKTMGWTIIL